MSKLEELKEIGSRLLKRKVSSMTCEEVSILRDYILLLKTELLSEHPTTQVKDLLKTYDRGIRSLEDVMVAKQCRVT